MKRLWILLPAISLYLSASGQSSRADLSSDANQILAQEVVISGTTTLDNSQLYEITSSLTARRMGEDGKEVSERIRDAFQQRGYFDANVTQLKIRPLDPLARPKTVRIEADVSEGTRFKIAGLEFTGNNSISAERLQNSFPIHIGDFFSIGEARSGLESIRKQYGSIGYLDFVIIPTVNRIGDGQLKLTFEITEGSQYRMGALEVVGKHELVDQLQPRWKLMPGEVFDPAYLDKFVDENQTSFPADFTELNDVSIIRDCRSMTVIVHLELDPSHPRNLRPKDIACDKGKASSEPTAH
jgi:outer membrane translocation and assembly module TamA